MGKKTETLCAWKKSRYTPDELLPVVSNPKYYCASCGRVSRKKKFLCKPDLLYPDS